MEPNLLLAPGCYGMSMCFREGSTECSTCPFAASCKPAAEAQLEMMRRELGVVAPKRKELPKSQPSAAGPTMQLTNGLPKKVAAWLDYIDREGIKINEALTKGENPFRGKRPAFLSIACHL